MAPVLGFVVLGIWSGTYLLGRGAVALINALKPTPPDTMEYWGGPVEHDPNIRVVFWGPKWLSSGNSIKSAVVQFLRLLPGSDYQNIVAQYWDKTGKVGLYPKLAATYIDPSSPSGRITSIQVTAEVRKVARLKGWPAGINQQYVVLGERGANTDDVADGNCGYHSWDTTQHLPLIYDFIPYEGSPKCGTGRNGESVVQVTTAALSHEVAEATTDPLGDAWRTSQSGSEIADKCESPNDQGFFVGDGGPMVDVNGLWDNTIHRCQSFLQRPVGEKLTVTPSGSHTRPVFDIDAQVRFPVYFPGETTRVTLHTSGYDMTGARFAVTPGCKETQKIDYHGQWMFGFACHSRRIGVATQVHTAPSPFNLVRGAFLYATLRDLGGQFVGLQFPPGQCTEAAVWRPGTGPKSNAGNQSKAPKCL